MMYEIGSRTWLVSPFRFYLVGLDRNTAVFGVETDFEDEMEDGLFGGLISLFYHHSFGEINPIAISNHGKMKCIPLHICRAVLHDTITAFVGQNLDPSTKELDIDECLERWHSFIDENRENSEEDHH